MSTSSFQNQKWIIFFLLFTWLHWVLFAAYGIYFPDQGWNPGSQHSEHGVSATGRPGKSLVYFKKGTDEHLSRT